MANVTVTANGLTSNVVDYANYQLALTGDGKFAFFNGNQTQTGMWQLLTHDTALAPTYFNSRKACIRKSTLCKLTKVRRLIFTIINIFTTIVLKTLTCFTM